MMTQSFYGPYEAYLQNILDDLQHTLETFKQRHYDATGQKLFEHVYTRLKTPKSMIEKLTRKQLSLTLEAALTDIKDAIGIRIICSFIDDIFTLVELFRQSNDITIVEEKDFITKAKPNGYRSYHLIVKISTPHPDIYGNMPGDYFVEVQLRTIAMDTWASLEHQLKYKRDIQNTQRIEKELKRCADELASCDLSLQTIRQLILEGGQ
ncbi:GTP pyrophosphokinase family protein [Carnobacteriaceae bacterium zg-ZUI252]|nr:GTP pyrophosphokinase family protein [Carnobacteriaceae bacterium zg-ZUI252]MBS4770349.1 GTP pyrophosphokinase family protein [Carnobacteriaceae bacterium zg-ZUI240]